MAHSRLIIEKPTLDEDEFNALTDLLYEALDGNNAKCARLLGVSRTTWMKWNKEPPEWPYWNIVLRHILTQILAALQARRGSKLWRKKGHIVQALSRLKHSDEFSEEVSHLAVSYTEAERHLLKILGGGGMYWDKIKLPAHSGGHSPRMLRAAAKQLGVRQTQEGYGEDKRSFWTLPWTSSTEVE